MKRRIAILTATGFVLSSAPMLAGCDKNEQARGRYEITAEYSPETKTVAGAVKVTFENVTECEISVLKFQLYPNAYRKNALYSPVPSACAESAYYDGESYGEIVVSSVNGSKNWEIMGEDQNLLYAYLEKPLYTGDKVVLDIGFVTKLASVNHRTGVTAHTTNLANFYPVLCGLQDGEFYETVYYSDGDPFFFDSADYTVRLTVPKDYEVASTGTIVDERMLESKKAYTMSASSVRDFAMVVAKDYRVLETVEGETRLVYQYYKDENPQKTLDCARESFAYYQETFGEYPYPTYTLAETGLCFGGMEYPCLTMLSDELTDETRFRAVAHETAHQWWGMAVGNNPIENAWQDEGLAEYSAFCFFDEYEKYGFTCEDLTTDALKEYRSYYDVYGSVLGRTDTRMTRHLKEFVSDYEYRCITFDKAVVMFGTLRKSIGDKKFFNSLKKYYESNRYKTVGVGELVASFEKSGADVSGFFDSFLNGKGVL